MPSGGVGLTRDQIANAQFQRIGNVIELERFQERRNDALQSREIHVLQGFDDELTRFGIEPRMLNDMDQRTHHDLGGYESRTPYVSIE